MRGIKIPQQDFAPGGGGAYLRDTTVYESVSQFVLASSPGHSQILSRSRGEKSGEGLGSKLRHGPEMVDSVCTNRVHHFRSVK